VFFAPSMHTHARARHAYVVKNPSEPSGNRVQPPEPGRLRRAAITGFGVSIGFWRGPEFIDFML
jgi:hypothetical protein